ncbi:MAG: glutamate synthase subunit beta [bacterium]|nr:glutamate synthase subunit beta [bacterium]
MADPRGFLTHRERELPGRRPVEVRIRDWKDVYEEREENSPIVRRQASRCMDCGVPFCHLGCPLGNLIPDWNDLVHRGDWEEAIDRLHATNNFPDFTGRLCPAPCEDSCVLGINQPPVTIKNVELHIIEEAFQRGLVKPEPPDQLTDKTVAVIGSGPAGLAAAQQLTRAGHTVAVFERDDAIGGLLRYGIPEFKMETSVLERRLDQMRAEGTIFRTGIHLGAEGNPGGADLLESYDAVVLATGATVHRELGIEGRELDGIHRAMDYLPHGNRESRGETVSDQISASGKDVVVIGGGDTGSDCIGTAVRQGARSITQLQYRPQPPAERGEDDPWPTYPNVFRVSTSQEEGGERHFSAVTVRFAGEDGHVSGLVLQDSEQVDGMAVPVPGTERELPAQLVLLAMGFSGAERGGLADQLGIQFDDRSRMVRDGGYATEVPGVFVAGDAGRGQSLIVWAIAEGRAAAAAVDSYLRGGPSELDSPVTPTERQLRP